MTGEDIDRVRQAGLAHALSRQRSVSLRYAIGTGMIMAAALWFHDARLAVPVYLVFVAWLWIRYRELARHVKARSTGLADRAGQGGDSVS